MGQNKSSNDKRNSKSAVDVSQKHAETILQSMPQDMKGKKIDEKLLKQVVLDHPPSLSSIYHSISIKEDENTKKRLEQSILQSEKNPEKLIIESGDLHFIVACAAYVEGLNIRILEYAIINSGDPEAILLFATKVKGAEIKALEQAIIRSRDINFIQKFAQEVKGADKKLLEQAIDKIKEKYAEK